MRVIVSGAQCPVRLECPASRVIPDISEATDAAA
jgi:hypothetical protein